MQIINDMFGGSQSFDIKPQAFSPPIDFNDDLTKSTFLQTVPGKTLRFGLILKSLRVNHPDQ